MLKRKIAYIDASGKPVICLQPRRNRLEKVRRGSVAIDSDGNISHPPIANLACFGNPVEYHRGTSDKRKTFKGVQGPAVWCDGCKSRPACSETVKLRVDADPDLTHKLADWEVSTSAMRKPSARFEHASFTEFAVACYDRKWTSDNDVQLSGIRTAAAKKGRQDRDKEKKKVRRGKPITLPVLQAIDVERDRRHDLLLAAAYAPGAPPRLSKLKDPAIVAFTSDVWRTLTLLERRYGGEVTGGDVTRALLGMPDYAGRPPESLRRRVNEVIKRVRWLEGADNGAPVWEADFDGELGKAPRPDDGDLGGVVWEVLEEA